MFTFRLFTYRRYYGLDSIMMQFNFTLYMLLLTFKKFETELLPPFVFFIIGRKCLNSLGFLLFFNESFHCASVISDTLNPI
jgi:hypothetical protein